MAYRESSGYKIGTVRKNITLRRDHAEAIEMRYFNASRLINDALDLAIWLLEHAPAARANWINKEEDALWRAFKSYANKRC